MKILSFACALSALSVVLLATIPPVHANSNLRGTVAQGDLPGPGTAGVYAVRTPEQWQKFQAEAKVTWDVSIDFNRDMVLAVLLGTRNTAGYKVVLNAIRTEEWYTEVSYSEVPPPPMTTVAQMLTNPYVITVVARSEAPVVFSKGHFGTIQIPYEEFTRMVRQTSEMNYQLEDERRQKGLAEGRVRDLMDLLARTSPPPTQ